MLPTYAKLRDIYESMQGTCCNTHFCKRHDKFYTLTVSVILPGERTERSSASQSEGWVLESRRHQTLVVKMVVKVTL